MGARWATALVLSDSRHDHFVGKFRQSGVRSPAVGPLHSILAELAGGGDMLLIFGYDSDEEPALPIQVMRLSKQALLSGRSAATASW